MLTVSFCEFHFLFAHVMDPKQKAGTQDCACARVHTFMCLKINKFFQALLELAELELMTLLITVIGISRERLRAQHTLQHTLL